jgi:hypothetical protein
VPALVSDWCVRLSEPVRLRSRHPALDQFYRSAVYCEEFRFSVTETGDTATFHFATSDLLAEANVSISEIQADHTASVTITEYDGLF